jgi:hypothetical protein
MQRIAAPRARANSIATALLPTPVAPTRNNGDGINGIFRLRAQAVERKLTTAEFKIAK